MSSDKGAMPKGWDDESKIESCCKNDKNLLIVGAVIGIVTIISTLVIFELFVFPQLFTILYSILYGFAFCGIVFLVYAASVLIHDYCKPALYGKDTIALGFFCIISIVVIVVVLLCITNIESAYYESHFHNALQSNTLDNVYSELDCRVIDKFRSSKYDNQPTWHPREFDLHSNGLMGWSETPLFIPVPEICKQ